MKQQGFSVVEAMIALVVVGAIAGSGYAVAHSTHHKKVAAAPSAHISSQTTTGPAMTAASDTSDAALQTDLSSATASQNQANSDAAQSNTALNDQSQQITVPTN